MRRKITSAIAMFLLLPGLAATAQAVPALHGTTLSGAKVELPTALAGHVGVLVLGFSQGSREGVTAWGKRLAADFGESAEVLYFEMPLLESVPRLLRGWVLKKIRESVPERAQPRFLPVLDHEREWKAAAGFSKADDAYVLVVDAKGTVRWKMDGPVTDAAEAEMKRQVAAASK